ncbi:DUF6612 family protein [Nesterenkonia xinjiangensis]|uniref:LppX_LprAFG lipoprotein n=1 Tax=Nesterenkonia xinjiangensis TaxID=225327 RepID=A0A7Z0GKR7_9MICC|nr:DUF6612 family protein [Nesterenkonia xinjiangensis]NYJ76921.1 hypothetical protein [Nesterenkonia xinjiangensis]
MTRTPCATGATSIAGIALLTLTGCVGLGPGESQAGPSTDATRGDGVQIPDEHGAELVHPLEDPEIFAEMRTAAEDLESLRMGATMTFELDAPWLTQEQHLEMTAEGAADFSEVHVTASLTEQGDPVEDIEAYIQDGTGVENIDDQGWTDSPSSTIDEGTDSTYAAVLEAVIAMEDLLEVDYDDDSYTLEYAGSDAEIFDSLEDPFSLNLDGYEPEETDMTVEVLLDPQTLLMEEFEFTLYTQESPNPISLGMEISVEYSMFNEVPPLEIPEDVLEEAYGPQH